MSIRKSLVILTWFMVTVCTTSSTTTTDEEEMRKARLAAKPWFLKSLEVGGTDFFVSPATIFISLFFLVQVYYSLIGTRKYCEASHILFKETPSTPTPKLIKSLEAMVKDIGGNSKKFGEIAAKYSQCPSKVKDGDLGRFYEGDMAPQFDRICFHPATKVGTTLGPVQTQFGFHLIYIRKRSI